MIQTRVLGMLAVAIVAGCSDGHGRVQEATDSPSKPAPSSEASRVSLGDELAGFLELLEDVAASAETPTGQTEERTR